MVEMDSIVSWYVEVLFLNIFRAPEPLMQISDKSAEAETSAKLDLVRFLIASRLAVEGNWEDGVQPVVASKKLTRNSKWLLAGKKPSRETDRYMWKLTRRAVLFLTKSGQADPITAIVNEWSVH
jgi:hypothetical protein